MSLANFRPLHNPVGVGGLVVGDPGLCQPWAIFHNPVGIREDERFSSLRTLDFHATPLWSRYIIQKNKALRILGFDEALNLRIWW